MTQNNADEFVLKLDDKMKVIETGKEPVKPTVSERAEAYCKKKGFHPQYNSAYGAVYHAFIAGYTERDDEEEG